MKDGRKEGFGLAHTTRRILAKGLRECKLNGSLYNEMPVSDRFYS